LKGRSTLLDAALRMRLDAFGQECEYAVRDEFGRIPRHVSGICRSPCVSLQLASASCWLGCQARERAIAKEKSRSRFPVGQWIFLHWFPAPPRYLATLIPICLLLMFHAMNVLVVLLVVVAELLPRDLVTRYLATLIVTQFGSQICALRYWLLSGLSDPGYCTPTPRLDADHPGPDGPERLVNEVQNELNGLLRRLCDLPSTDGKISVPEAEALQIETERDTIKAAIESGKEKLASRLNHASEVRLGCYPSDYVAFVSGDKVEKNPPCGVSVPVWFAVA